jgi:hypothetical protein
MIKNKQEIITTEECSECRVGIQFSFEDLESLDDSSVIVTPLGNDSCDIYYHGDIKCPFCGYYESIAGNIEHQG